MAASDTSGAEKIDQADEERGRRKAAIVFVLVYVLFMLTVIVLMAVRSHDLGYGWT